MFDLDIQTEKAECAECISHLAENVGPDHVIVKYAKALEEVERLRSENQIIADRAAHNAKQDAARAELQAARIKGLEAKFAEVQSLYDAMHKLSTIEGAMKAEAYVKMLEAAFLKLHVAHSFTKEHNDGGLIGEREQRAREELERIKAETGSGDHVVGADQMVLTAEQRKALDIAHKLLWEQYEFDESVGPAAEAIGKLLAANDRGGIAGDQRGLPRLME